MHRIRELLVAVGRGLVATGTGTEAGTAGWSCTQRRGRPSVGLFRRRSAPALLALVLLTLSGCSGGQSAGSGESGTSSSSADPGIAAPPGHLVYGRTTYPDVQTFFTSTEEGELRLTDPGEYCCVLRVSPDHQRILTLPGELTPPLRGGTLAIDGSDFQPLPADDPSLNLIPQAWSPDGDRIAFEGWDDGDPARTGAYIAAVDGSGLVRVTDRPGAQHDIPLDFSPDGTQLLFYRSVGVDPDPYVGGSLWVVGVDGANAHPVAEASARPDVRARWSPDGSRILFANERTTPSGALWTVRPDGSGLTELFSDQEGRFPIQPVWSPDGSQILFALDPTNDRFTHPNNELVVVDADGSGLQVVSDSPDFKFPADWWS